MDFIKKHKNIFEIVLIVLLLATTLGISIPIAINNISKVQEQAIRLESKAKAKEAWQKEFDEGNIEKGEKFLWDDGTYYWVIDEEGNITENK